MTEAREGEEADDVMRRKCRELVAWAKQQGWNGPAFDPEILAGLLRILVQSTDEDIEGDGRIFPVRDRAVIQYRSNQTVERQRFTICHEIAHTLFPDFCNMVRHHNAEVDSPGHRAFEELCNIGASELLMPLEDFARDMAKSRLDIQHADALRRRYLASLEAALKRLIDLTDHPCAALFLTDESFKDFRAVARCMRVKWIWCSKTFKGFIRSGTLLSPGCCLPQDCKEVCRPFPRLPETWQIDEDPAFFYVEAMRLPVISGYPKVVALLHERIPPAPKGRRRMSR